MICVFTYYNEKALSAKSTVELVYVIKNQYYEKKVNKPNNSFHTAIPNSSRDPPSIKILFIRNCHYLHILGHARLLAFMDEIFYLFLNNCCCGLETLNTYIWKFYILIPTRMLLI